MRLGTASRFFQIYPKYVIYSTKKKRSAHTSSSLTLKASSPFVGYKSSHKNERSGWLWSSSVRSTRGTTLKKLKKRKRKKNEKENEKAAGTANFNNLIGISYSI